jgi:hypothetical protein
MRRVSGSAEPRRRICQSVDAVAPCRVSENYSLIRRLTSGGGCCERVVRTNVEKRLAVKQAQVLALALRQIQDITAAPSLDPHMAQIDQLVKEAFALLEFQAYPEKCPTSVGTHRRELAPSLPAGSNSQLKVSLRRSGVG